MKYMCGGPVKKARGGMMDEGISTRPTTASGRRMTNEELGMTPGGVDPAKKKPMAKGAGVVGAALAASKKAAGLMKNRTGMGAMTEGERRMLMEAAAKKPAVKGAAAGAAGSGVMAAARAAARAAATRFGGQVTEDERRMMEAATKKGVPAHSSKPMIRRKAGGLSVMPKGKC